MSELLQGFLACAGSALFLGTMLIAVRAIFHGSQSRHDDESYGAPEGDQLHFRISEDDVADVEKRKRRMGMR